MTDEKFDIIKNSVLQELKRKDITMGEEF